MGKMMIQLNPNSGATVYDVDSLLGNFNDSFKIKIQEMDYYLRDLIRMIILNLAKGTIMTIIYWKILLDKL